MNHIYGSLIIKKNNKNFHELDYKIKIVSPKIEISRYFEYDNEKGERKIIANAIKEKFPELDAVIGGQISVDIYPKGKDKSQILDVIKQDRLVEVDEYVFIGDRIEGGGMTIH